MLAQETNGLCNTGTETNSLCYIATGDQRFPMLQSMLHKMTNSIRYRCVVIVGFTKRKEATYRF